MSKFEYTEELVAEMHEAAGSGVTEDVIETLLGVEIVDESDQEGIDDGVHHEDMRELAKQSYEDSEPE